MGLFPPAVCRTWWALSLICDSLSVTLEVVFRSIFYGYHYKFLFLFPKHLDLLFVPHPCLTLFLPLSFCPGRSFLACPMSLIQSWLCYFSLPDTSRNFHSAVAFLFLSHFQLYPSACYLSQDTLSLWVPFMGSWGPRLLALWLGHRCPKLVWAPRWSHRSPSSRPRPAPSL